MSKEEEKKVLSHSTFSVDIILKLTEVEARALYNMTVYGHKPFTEWFYKHLGKAYLKPHEEGLISLFETISKELPKHIDKADLIRKTLKQQL